MRANKRIRDLRRRGRTHLRYVDRDGLVLGTTTFPTEDNKVVRTPKRVAK